MEKISKPAKKKPNPVASFIKGYVSEFGFRQIATLLMLAAAIVLIVGVVLPNITVILVGMYGYIAASALGILGCVLNMVKLNRRSPAWKRGLFNLIVLSVLFIIALLSVILIPIYGIYR